MNEYRYILQPYTGKASRHTCPGCGRKGEFARYIDTETGEPVGDNVGRCNHVNKCGYHYTPKQYFEANGIKPERVEVYIPKPQPPPRPPSYINADVFNNSLQGYDKNNLVKYLNTIMKPPQVNELIRKYKIGTSARYGGGTTVFWQVDVYERIRTGKLIKYDLNGHRIKGKQNWVHSVLKLKDFNLKQCLFGEHLLKENPRATVGIVESEKTAMIASVFIPELIWLATGGADGLNKEKAKPLRGREVILFPDASTNGRIYNKWKEKADEFGFKISDYLETNTTEKQKADGVDIADFLSADEAEPPPEPWGETKQVPYNTPSPVAVIDSRIENPPKFEGLGLVVKNRVFTSANGDKIELVGLRDYGYCGNWKKHKEAGGYCKPCLLNCMHTLKINGKLQSREYTQLEILILQNNN